MAYVCAVDLFFLKQLPEGDEGAGVKLVMPAIYRLDIGKDGSKGGWHRLGDLVAAVNNLFVEQGVLCRYLAWDILLHYWNLTVGQRLRWIDGGEIMTATDPKEITAREDVFVPAGWGVAVVEAVKRGAVHIFINQQIPIGEGPGNFNINVKDLVRAQVARE